MAAAVHPQIAAANPSSCPPGLAKKNPPCVPPGQAKKGNITQDWTNWDRLGEVVDRDEFVYLDDYLRYGLSPLPAGQRNAIVDGRIVVIDAESYRLLQLIRLFTALVD